MATFIDFHVLLTLPPNNINRGEDGAPKTAFFGGVQRQRISSQALKAAQRRAFTDYLDASDLGVRTARVIELIANEILRRDETIEEGTAQQWAKGVFTKAGIQTGPPRTKKNEGPKPDVSKHLMFLGRHQIERLAEVLIERQGAALTKKEAQAIIDENHSIDLALFGRMVADVASLNVDAACQYAHAIAVHESASDFDYYTAIDDVRRDEEIAGAGMIGTVELMSSTLYRYATINVDQLKKNLGDDQAVRRAIEAFTATFIESLPTGKQNGCAALSLPDLVSVMVRERRPVNLVNAFENPVTGVSRREEAVKRLSNEARIVEEAFGAEPQDAWLVTTPAFATVAEGLGELVTSDELISHVADAAAAAAQEVK